MAGYKVGYIIGSLAQASINRKLAIALSQLAPDHLHMSEIPIGDLPLYSYDFDKDYPPVATAFKEAIKGSDAILIVTPEYNRSIPGALKNAIDWASRPYGTNAFAGKPTAVIGTSPGAIGTAVGQQALRPILGYLQVLQMSSPEGYIQFKPDLIDDEGRVSVPDTEAFLRTYMETFAQFIGHHLRPAG
ncbi:NADPH-dependent FMN reductase [Brevundimonas vesicularis]|uniref:NADPH-dependent FMN reductase n=1 Tax=Brevundimonas vesicularis TaxID=41276 RepID=UPI0038D3EE84